MTAGQARVRCCDASGYRSVGSSTLLQALEGAREHLGLPSEQVAIQPVGCLRWCGQGPLVAAEGADGAVALYGKLTPDLAAPLLQQLVSPASTPPSSLAAHGIDPAHPFLALQKAVVLETCGQINPESIAEALAAGTYGQFRRCLLERTPQEVREQVKRSGLRGRGGVAIPPA